jgi:hypothetical protein
MKLNFSNNTEKMNSETLKWNVMLIRHGHYMCAHMRCLPLSIPLVLTQLWCRVETMLYSSHGNWCVAYSQAQVLYKADISSDKKKSVWELYNNKENVSVWWQYYTHWPLFYCLSPWHHILTHPMCGIKLRTIKGFQNEKIIPILNESGFLKIHIFKMNLTQ